MVWKLQLLLLFVCLSPVKAKNKLWFDRLQWNVTSSFGDSYKNAINNRVGDSPLAMKSCEFFGSIRKLFYKNSKVLVTPPHLRWLLKYPEAKCGDVLPSIVSRPRSTRTQDIFLAKPQLNSQTHSWYSFPRAEFSSRNDVFYL